MQRERLIYLTTCLEGHNVKVEVFGGSVFSGIFHEYDVEKKFGITLKMARLMKDSSGIVTDQPTTKTMFISAKELVQIIAKGVPLTKSGLVDEVESDEKDELWIDPSIWKSWFDDDDTESCPESDISDKYWIRGWDQFDSDGSLFEYDINDIEEVVVTKIDLGLEMKKKLEMRAIQIAKGDTTSDPHLAEAPPSSSATSTSEFRGVQADPPVIPPSSAPSTSVCEGVHKDSRVMPPGLDDISRAEVEGVQADPRVIPPSSAPSTSVYEGVQKDSRVMPPGLDDISRAEFEGAQADPRVIPPGSAPSTSVCEGVQKDSRVMPPGLDDISRAEFEGVQTDSPVLRPPSVVIPEAAPSGSGPSTSERRSAQTDSDVTLPLPPLGDLVMGFMLMAPTGSCVNTLILVTPSEESSLNPNANQSEGTLAPPNCSAQPSTSELRGVRPLRPIMGLLSHDQSTLNPNAQLSVGTNLSLSSQLAPQPVISQAQPSNSALDGVSWLLFNQPDLNPNAPRQEFHLNPNAMVYQPYYGLGYYRGNVGPGTHMGIEPHHPYFDPYGNQYAQPYDYYNPNGHQNAQPYDSHDPNGHQYAQPYDSHDPNEHQHAQVYDFNNPNGHQYAQPYDSHDPNGHQPAQVYDFNNPNEHQNVQLYDYYDPNGHRYAQPWQVYYRPPYPRR